MGMCPGCGRPLLDTAVCCDDCWARAPADLPGWPAWRLILQSEVGHGLGETAAPDTVDRIHTALRAWLRANPPDMTTP
jgi:hypothetical protein